MEYGVDDTLQNGRGAALADIFYKGNLDIIIGNWNGSIEFMYNRTIHF